MLNLVFHTVSYTESETLIKEFRHHWSQENIPKCFVLLQPRFSLQKDLGKARKSRKGFALLDLWSQVMVIVMNFRTMWL